jgi:hypothetical protein
MNVLNNQKLRGELFGDLSILGFDHIQVKFIVTVQAGISILFV